MLHPMDYANFPYCLQNLGLKFEILGCPAGKQQNIISGCLRDNFRNIVDRMNLKWSMYATQDCLLEHKCDTKRFL